jgi:hypothetical protein
MVYGRTMEKGVESKTMDITLINADFKPREKWVDFVERLTMASLFQPLDWKTMSEWQASVEKYLTEKHCTNFLVVCDNSLNTDDTIEEGEFHGEVYFKQDQGVDKYVVLGRKGYGVDILELKHEHRNGNGKSG